MKYLCDIWLFQFDYCADTFCLISASTRARIIGELDQQTMKVDLKDHAGPFICLCLNADSPRCQTVHLYTWWAMGKIVIFLTILNYLFLLINILIILINCTPVHMVGNAHWQAHNLPQTFCFGTLSDGRCRFVDSFTFVFSRYEKSVRVSTSVISASKKSAQKNVKTLNISIKMPKSLRKTPEISIKRPFGQ